MEPIVLDETTKSHVAEFTEAFVELLSGNINIFTVISFLFELCQMVEKFTDIHGEQKKNLILYVIGEFAKEKGWDIDLPAIGQIIDMIIKVDLRQFVIKSVDKCEACCNKCFGKCF